MVQRGRPTRADLMLRRLRSSPLARERVLAVVLNLGGGLSVSEACRRTGVGRTLFRRHRLAFLNAGAAALEPRPRGRPPKVRSAQAPLVGRLRDRIADLEEDLAFARAREELLRIAPYRTWPKKKGRAHRRAPRETGAGRCSPASGPSRFGPIPGTPARLHPQDGDAL